MNIWVKNYSAGKTSVERVRIQKVWDECAQVTKEADGARPFGGQLPVFARTALAFQAKMISSGIAITGDTGISKSL